MSDVEPQPPRLSRRALLSGGLGLGGLALASLLDPRARAAAGASAPTPGGAVPGGEAWRGIATPTHVVPRARRVIHLYMAGGPSQFESFDHKPVLAEMDGKPIPDSFTAGQPIAQLQFEQRLLCMGPQYPFARHGQSGQEVSSLFPRIAGVADRICIVRSMQTEQINHDPAHTFFNTGTSISGRPSMGAWLLYGLGSEARDLPGFVVLISTSATPAQPISARQWSSGFLPSRFQGVKFHSGRSPVLYLGRPGGVDAAAQRRAVDAVQSLDRIGARHFGDPDVDSRVRQYETAFRMQTSVPELTDLSDEPAHVLDLYGVQPGQRGFAANCLLARRLAERGVRFVQVYHRGWDHHDSIRQKIPITAGEVDRASAALVQDLDQRGLLEDTLVIWGGEFGRTPIAQGDGRDHHIRGYSMWLAGGGIRGGLTWGATDELGYFAVEDPVHVHDLHATMLHLLGIDHERLTFRYQGRDFRLTDVHGRVVHGLLA